ncbi:MAG: laccase domain-containing protein [Candidatus Schekmanbacteria bacterium]|nr:laccase domain-containing protein [Candidatus Schekmanbacteria bacterium]
MRADKQHDGRAAVAIEHSERLTLVRGLAPGVGLAFSTRRGGVSQGAFAALNLSARTGDNEAAVGENWGLLARELEECWELRGPLAPLGVEQIHGTDIVDAAAAAAPGRPTSGMRTVLGSGDGLFLREPDLTVSVLTADCLPIALVAASGSRGVLVHAGWRGLAAGIVGRAAAVLRLRSTPPEETIAFMGPGIGPCCFEVGAEVRATFLSAFGDDAESSFVAVAGRARWRADLGRLAALELEGAGIRRRYSLSACTCCHAEAYFSHRRDGPVTGRMATILRLGVDDALKPPPDRLRAGGATEGGIVAPTVNGRCIQDAEDTCAASVEPISWYPGGGARWS